MRFITFIIVALCLVTACSKKETSTNSEEYKLYGKWEMGNQVGDTLEFLNKNGKNVLLYEDSRFIGGVYMEREYKYVNGVLYVRMYPPEDFSTITSFAWVQQGSEFSILGNQLYPLLNATPTLVYRKVP